MRHVGNVHPQPPMAAVERLQRNRVVEIAGVGRVDGDDRLSRSGRAAPAGSTRRTAPPPAGPLPRRPRRSVGQVELAEDRQRIHPRLAPRPEHFHDHPFAVLHGRGEADHLEDHLVVARGALGAGSPTAIGWAKSVPSTATYPRRRTGNTCRRTAGSGARGPRRLRRAGPRRRPARRCRRPTPRRRWRRRRSISAGCRCPPRGRLPRPGGGRAPGVGRRPDEAETLGGPLEDADGLVARNARGTDLRGGAGRRRCRGRATNGWPHRPAPRRTNRFTALFSARAGPWAGRVQRNPRARWLHSPSARPVAVSLLPGSRSQQAFRKRFHGPEPSSAGPGMLYLIIGQHRKRYKTGAWLFSMRRSTSDHLSRVEYRDRAIFACAFGCDRVFPPALDAGSSLSAGFGTRRAETACHVQAKVIDVLCLRDSRRRQRLCSAHFAKGIWWAR